ncbi:PPC domain-containing protein [Sorangium sp. So ce131]|uniref:PPC domain-containing protein n=1 Tax=Sorangium sp. So ce131 TaxID=3133282 RepID=UPI003F6201CC
MRSMYLLGLVVIGTVAATAAGCGGDDEGSGGDGGAGGAGGATSSSTTSSTSVVATTSSAGGEGDENNSIETAEDIDFAAWVDATLEPVDADQDFYRFSGTKGQILAIETDAKPDDDPSDPTYPDLVVTLLDAEGTQLAQNDDQTPGVINDSLLYTVLPADGDYYLRLEECTSAFGTQGCASADEILDFDYSVRIFTVNVGADEEDSLVGETEPNDDAEQAGALGYDSTVENQQTVYYRTFVFGGFESATDVDVYSFTLPETPPAASGLKARFEVYGPTGPDGNGSTVDVSEVAVFSAADLTTAYAKVDASKGGDIEVPVQIGEEGKYFVFVKRAPGDVGANDFYILLHNRVESQGAESEDVANNDAATPEGDLASFENQGRGTSYVVDGQLVTDGDTPDVDFYEIPLPENVEAGWTVSAFCGAQRHGSGLRELKVELLNGDGTEIGADYTSTESDTEEALIDGLALPATVAENRLLAKVSSGTPAEDVTSRSYNCLFAYLPPQTN